MNVKDKLEVFSRLAKNEAEEKKRLMIGQIEAEFEEACRTYEQKARKRSDILLREENFKAEREHNKEILYSKSEVKRSLYDLKAQLMDSLFEGVGERISDYIEKEAYGESLVAAISKLTAQYDCKIDVFLTSRDMIYADRIRVKPNITLNVDDSLIGGFRATIFEKNIALDYSFKERLKEARSNFKGFRMS